MNKEKAILAKIEQEELIEDSRDIVKLQTEEPKAIPFEEYLKKRNLHEPKRKFN